MGFLNSVELYVAFYSVIEKENTVVHKSRRILAKGTRIIRNLNMLLKFAIRFMAVLFAVLALAAVIIHFFFSSKLTTDLWIIAVPVILAVPILSSIFVAKDDELSI